MNSDSSQATLPRVARAALGHAHPGRAPWPGRAARRVRGSGVLAAQRRERAGAGRVSRRPPGSRRSPRARRLRRRCSRSARSSPSSIPTGTSGSISPSGSRARVAGDAADVRAGRAARRRPRPRLRPGRAGGFAPSAAGRHLAPADVKSFPRRRSTIRPRCARIFLQFEEARLGAGAGRLQQHRRRRAGDGDRGRQDLQGRRASTSAACRPTSWSPPGPSAR